ncbi:MAG: alkanesulfonate monooxygenase SsuD, partial [Acidimicrobiales bacterium]
QAHADAKDLVERGYRGLGLERLLTGSVETVAERVAALAALGVDDVIVRCASPDQNIALETLHVLGQIRE